MKRLSGLLLLIALITAKAAFANEAFDITLLFTTDIHSNAVEHTALINGEPETVGGFARLKTAVDANYAEGKTLLLDSGDFSMATLYQEFTRSDALELTIMDHIGYDAAALGNHDFEVTREGLVSELDTFHKNGGEMPLLCSNLVEKGARASAGQFDNPLSDSGVLNYAVIDRNGFKIGLFALMGEDAEKYTPAETLGFDDRVKTAKACVKALRETEGADMVVLLSHCGTLPDGSFDEDARIAGAVSGIDVILSGHQHVLLEDIVRVNDTVIVCAGTALTHLGRLDMTKTSNGWDVLYELIPLTDHWAQDEEIASRLEVYTKRLNDEYLKKYGVSRQLNEVFAYSPYGFPDASEMGKKCGNYALGALMNDAYLDTLNDAGVKGVRASMIPMGIVRAGIYQGPLTVMDAYNVLSYGISPLDGSSGAPLVTFYVTGRELYDLCEASISLSGVMNSAQLLMGGIRYTYSMTRPILDRVYKVEIMSPDTGEYEYVSRDDRELYYVACSWTSMQSVALIKSNTYGLLSVTPKDETGAPLDTLEERAARIVREPDGRELKEWYALYSYIEEMPIGETGLPTIDARYGHDAEFMIEDNGNIFTLFVNPSRAALIMIGAGAGLILIIILIIAAVRRRARKKSIVGNV